MQNLYMKNNNAHLRRYRTGRSKSLALRTNKRRFSSNISENYLMMLQIYCLNKKEAAAKKELRYEGRIRRPANAAAKPSLSISATIISYLNENLSLFKKGKTGMAMATVTE